MKRVGLPELRPNVDEGEAEAIFLAYLEKANLLLIDEKRGRQAAETLKIPVMGTGGILVIAKRRGLVNRVEPLLRRFQASGYRFSPDLSLRILQLAGES